MGLHRLAALSHAAADLLLGASCPGCGAPRWGICEACLARLGRDPSPIERGLGVPLMAACPYRPVLARVLPRYKDDGALHLDQVLGGLLARAVAALDPSPAVHLVPVPSLPAAVRSRGYDHARRLAAVAARATGLAVTSALSRSGRGADQSGLNRAQRSANLDGAMRAGRVAAPLVVVDDIATTGASLREAVRALNAAGNQVVGAAVIADAR